MNSDFDKENIEAVLNGSKDAFNTIYGKYYPLIYNFCYRSCGDQEEAKDFTQETFIKVFTHLKDFKFQGSLKNWIFRIAKNHLLDQKSFKKEQLYLNELEHNITEPAKNIEESLIHQELVDNTKNKCLSGVLYCLDLEQRMIYVTGELFKVGHENGAMIFGITKDNFRKKLSRARDDLNNFLESRCGLLNKNNPCKCYKKTNHLIKLGLVNKDTHQFTEEYKFKINSIVGENSENIDDVIEDAAGELFSTLPYYVSKQEGKDMLDDLFTPELKKTIFMK